MDTLQAAYREEEDDDEEEDEPANHLASATTNETVEPTVPSDPGALDPPQSEHQNGTKTDAEASDDLSESVKSQDNEDEDDEDPPPKKQKHLSALTEQPSDLDQTRLSQPISNYGGPVSAATPAPATTATNSKKSKKKNNNVWVTKSTRKGKKKNKGNNNNAPVEDTVLITPVPRFPDKSDDTPDMQICLSKVYKAEKVELSEDRLSAGSTKGYRMVRATRGVVEGAWYFEIRVVKLGETGHTRLGWSTEKGDLQAPVGYDGNSFGYRDIDGSKVHKALREKYGEEGYNEGDVIGFYINLPDGGTYAPKQPHLVWYKGQRYVYAADAKEDPPKVVPGE